jgi:AMP-binding enzyme
VCRSQCVQLNGCCCHLRSIADTLQPAYCSSISSTLAAITSGMSAWLQANWLRSVGVKKGDAVCIYMPMLPELPIAMLACARIGAVHSVVFAGFSSESLAQRIEDCKSNVVITCNGAALCTCTGQLCSVLHERLESRSQMAIRILDVSLLLQQCHMRWACFEHIASYLCQVRCLLLRRCYLACSAAVMRGPKRIDLKKIVDKGLELAKRSAEVSITCHKQQDSSDGITVIQHTFDRANLHKLRQCGLAQEAGTGS